MADFKIARLADAKAPFFDSLKMGTMSAVAGWLTAGIASETTTALNIRRIEAFIDETLVPAIERLARKKAAAEWFNSAEGAVWMMRMRASTHEPRNLQKLRAIAPFYIATAGRSLLGSIEGHYADYLDDLSVGSLAALGVFHERGTSMGLPDLCQSLNGLPFETGFAFCKPLEARGLIHDGASGTRGAGYPLDRRVWQVSEHGRSFALFLTQEI